MLTSDDDRLVLFWIVLPSNISKKSNCTTVGGTFLLPYTPKMASLEIVKLNLTNCEVSILNSACKKDFEGIDPRLDSPN